MSDVDELRRVWLFEGLTEDQLGSLSPFTYRKKFGPGELIVEEGHTGNGLYLIVSGDVRRYGPIVRYVAIMDVVFGAALCVIDYRAGMPLVWTLGEGPPLMILGGIMFYLLRSVPAE